MTISYSGTAVAGGTLTLTCSHNSAVMNPTYEWFDDSGNTVGNRSTLVLNPLVESNGGEYSCLVVDGASDTIGCGVERFVVQGMNYMYIINDTVICTQGFDRYSTSPCMVDVFIVAYMYTLKHTCTCFQKHSQSCLV